MGAGRESAGLRAYDGHCVVVARGPDRAYVNGIEVVHVQVVEPGTSSGSSRRRAIPPSTSSARRPARTACRGTVRRAPSRD